MNDSKPAPLYSLQRPPRWIWHFQYTEWSHKKTSSIEAKTLHGDKILIFLIALCFLQEQILSSKKPTYSTVNGVTFPFSILEVLRPWFYYEVNIWNEHIFPVTGDRLCIPLNQMSAATNYSHNVSPLKLQSKSSTHSGCTPRVNIWS